MKRWSLLGFAALVTSVVVASCGTSGVHTASLAQLVAHDERYDGVEVATTCRVDAFADLDERTSLVLENSRHDRVELRPASVATRYRGSRVEVTGCFTVDPAAGRSLRIDRIERRGAGRPVQWRNVPHVAVTARAVPPCEDVLPGNPRPAPRCHCCTCTA